MTEPHVHDCTGPDMRCPCGYVFRAGRFLFSIEVYDNQTKTHIVNTCFNCDDVAAIVSELEEIVERLP